MSKKIVFTSTIKDANLVVPQPKPARNYIPQWFKDIPGINANNVDVDAMGRPNVNVKNCIPFLDGLTSGYIQETWTDIFIREDNGDIDYYFSHESDPKPMSHRDKSSYPPNEHFYEHEFVWRQPWIPKLPSGYSYIFTHPMSRIDLPFVTISAVVDGDKLQYSNNPIVPFYIKKGFTGVIPKGTPIYQFIPFKRETWNSETEPYNEDAVKKSIHDLRSNFVGSYKNRYWTKKEYN
jgi:hypothetical protein